MKRFKLGLALVCCFWIPSWALASGGGSSDNHLGIVMAEEGSRVERLARQRAYKARLEVAARERGWQPGEKREFASSGRQAKAPDKYPGQIICHSGALGTCCQNSFMVGNRFDSALGPSGMTIYPIDMSGSISMATFDIWQFNTDVPAVATGTVGGQGYHGISINDIVGTGFATIGSLNAAFAVAGEVLTPVELLNFEVE